jgi:hypothetical protein
MTYRSWVGKSIQQKKDDVSSFRLHWREYPFFYKVVCLLLLVVGCAVFVSEYLIVSTNETLVYLVLAPLGEELVKSSVVVVFLVSFVHFRKMKEKKVKHSSSILCCCLSFFFISSPQVRSSTRAIQCQASICYGYG